MLVKLKRKIKPNENVDVIFVDLVIRPSYKCSLIFKQILKTIVNLGI